jgi:hypothetical protein
MLSGMKACSREESMTKYAIEIHVAGLREDGLAVPAPSSVVNYLEVSV